MRAGTFELRGARERHCSWHVRVDVDVTIINVILPQLHLARASMAHMHAALSAAAMFRLQR